MHATARKRFAVSKTRPFARFAHKAHIRDADLWEAARLANEGRVDANLGGGVIKLRIARADEGKSGGSRCVILFRMGERAVFVHGFEKKDLGNIKIDELEAFRELARIVLGYSDAEIAKRTADGALISVEPPQEDGNA